MESELNRLQNAENGPLIPDDPGETGFDVDMKHILDSLAQGVMVADRNGTVKTFNKAAEKLTGLPSNQVVGKRVQKVLEMFLEPHSIVELQASTDPCGTAEVETEGDGKGGKGRFLSISSSVLMGPETEPVGAVFTLRDITRIKKLEEQANRTDRLAAMGEMAATIAHEIRNPLGSIELFTTALIKDLEEFGELEFLARHISSGVKSINTIISNLLLFVRPRQQLEFKIIDIHENLNGALFFSHHLMNGMQDISVATDFHEAPLMVNGDPELLKQMSLNLILNAVQAMPLGGKLTIHTRALGRRDRDLVEIGFTDTGKGISTTDMAKVFDPFFTTKSNGTGLGLSIVHNIVDAHGGSIDVTSPDAGGVRVLVALPAVKTREREETQVLRGE